MTLFLILLAVSGWIVAATLFGIIIFLMLAFGAAQELAKQEMQDMLKNTNTNIGSRKSTTGHVGPKIKLKGSEIWSSD